MPHLRPRILSSLVQKSLGWSPIVGVLGARQCGKTTLLKQFAEQTISFDLPRNEILFEKSGEVLLETAKKPLFLDEVQKYPPVFDLLKYVVDEKKRPGQFLITGSVRFASKRGIRESLTGRAVIWELLPLTLGETHSKGLSPFWDAIQEKSLPRLLARLQGSIQHSEDQLRTYVSLGGMPGICFLRDEVQRNAAFSSLIETVLERDFFFIRPTKLRPAILFDLLTELALSQGDLIVFSQFARKYRISIPTLKAVLKTFEDLFLIRWHGKVCFFEDLGIRSFLVHSRGQSLGRRIESLLYSEFRAGKAYLKDEVIRLSHYSTRGGAYLPFVLEGKSLGSIGVAVDEDDILSEKSRKSLYSFSTAKPKALLLHVHGGGRGLIYKDRILSVPVRFLV